MAGLKRTKNDIVTEQIKHVLGSHSLKDLFIQSLESMQRLQELNIFKHISLKIDTDKRASQVDQSLEVTFIVEEYGWLKSTVSAHAGTQSGDAVSNSIVIIVMVLYAARWAQCKETSYRSV